MLINGIMLILLQMFSILLPFAFRLYLYNTVMTTFTGMLVLCSVTEFFAGNAV
jgi:hypothetical protein